MTYPTFAIKFQCYIYQLKFQSNLYIFISMLKMGQKQCKTYILKHIIRALLPVLWLLSTIVFPLNYFYSEPIAVIIKFLLLNVNINCLLSTWYFSILQKYRTFSRQKIYGEMFYLPYTNWSFLWCIRYPILKLFGLLSNRNTKRTTLHPILTAYKAFSVHYLHYYTGAR